MLIRQGVLEGVAEPDVAEPADEAVLALQELLCSLLATILVTESMVAGRCGGAAVDVKVSVVVLLDLPLKLDHALV